MLIAGEVLLLQGVLLQADCVSSSWVQDFGSWERFEWRLVLISPPAMACKVCALTGSNTKCQIPCSCKQNYQRQRGFSVMSSCCGQQRDEEHCFLLRESLCGQHWVFQHVGKAESPQSCLQCFLCWVALQSSFSRSPLQFFYFQD